MAGQADFEESNIALLGSDLEKEVRKTAAETVEAYKNAGKAEGIEIWRIENFKVVPWKQHGTLYAGDSFIILNTYKQDDKLAFNIHFWLGQKTSQDEAGVAAYMTVVLDDLLGTTPVQFREVQDYESPEFISLWKDGLRILEGGVDSGFNHVSPDEYTTRLMKVKGKRNRVVVSEVGKSAKSMNHGDVFIVDGGLNLFQWNGKDSGPFEKNKAAMVVDGIRTEREGQPDVQVFEDGDENDAFWAAIGDGASADVLDAAAGGADADAKENDKQVVLKISDASGKIEMTEVASGDSISGTKLDSGDVFVLDIGSRVFVWVGSGASKNERRIGMKYATDYLARFGRPLHTPVTKVVEGSETAAFKEAIGA